MKVIPKVGTNQAVILEHLIEHGESTLREISNESDLTVKQLSDAVRSIEERGLVERRPNPNNPLQNLWSLSGGSE